VRFFDQECRALGWNEDIEAGAITGISFGHHHEDVLSLEEKEDAVATTVETFASAIPNFTVSTAQGSVVLVTTGSDLEAELLTHFQPDNVMAIAAHPTMTRVAIVGRGAVVQVWDYEQGAEICSRTLGEGLLPTAMTFSPDGHTLAVGFSDGQLWLLDALALAPVTDKTRFRVSNDSVTMVCFSDRGDYMATGDADRCVTLYHMEPANLEAPWLYVGKHRSHTRPICDLTFLAGEGLGALPRLLSLGADGMLMEYNLAESGFHTHLVIRERTALDQRECGK
jgi:WD40 repeat protein